MSEFVKVYTADDMKPENLSRNKLTLVDFWATWCGPCRMLSPIVDELASETPDVAFGKVDVDQYPEIAMGLGINSVPTLILYKDGKPVDKSIGVRPKGDIKRMIDSHR